jgi:SAM-dependent methyltransferase
MKNYVPFFQKLKFAWYCYNNTQQVPSNTYQKYPKNSIFEGKTVLNIGCGTNTFPAHNVVNTDLYNVPGVDLPLDLSKPPFPFNDNSFDLIIANHILEHVPNWWECFKDLARIVKVGGTIEVWLPGDGGSSQLGYRDHINMINHCSFVGIRGTWRNKANAWELKELEKVGFVKDLKIQYCHTRIIDYWWMQLLPERAINWCIRHLRNISSEHGWFFKKLAPLQQGEKTNGN